MKKTKNLPFAVVDDFSPSFFAGKRILVRVDYNVPLEKKDSHWRVASDQRLRFSLPTLNYLLSAQARVILVSHLDNPRGERVASLSLQPVAQKLNEIAYGLIGYRKKVKFCSQPEGKTVKREVKNMEKGEILMLENSRFLKGEEAGSLVLARRWARLGDFYVNDAFSCAHRRHASVVGIPRFLPHAAGFHFRQEFDFLNRLLTSPRRPVVLVLGGAKKDKVAYALQMAPWVDKILVGGKLVYSKFRIPNSKDDDKVLLGKLREDGQDISLETIKQFGEEIAQAGTVIFAGPVGNTTAGVFKGTEALFKRAIKSGAFTVAGGGDTEAALTALGLKGRIDYIASGGGAMLSFLAEKTLPGIEALK